MFQDMWDGCTIYHDPEYPDSVFYMKNGEWWFELDTKNNILWCVYEYLWGILKTDGKWDIITFKSFIKKQFGKIFKMMGVTPPSIRLLTNYEAQKRFRNETKY